MILFIFLKHWTLNNIQFGRAESWDIQFMCEFEKIVCSLTLSAFLFLASAWHIIRSVLCCAMIYKYFVYILIAPQLPNTDHFTWLTLNEISDLNLIFTRGSEFEYFLSLFFFISLATFYDIKQNLFFHFLFTFHWSEQILILMLFFLFSLHTKYANYNAWLWRLPFFFSSECKVIYVHDSFMFCWIKLMPLVGNKKLLLFCIFAAVYILSLYFFVQKICRL